MPTETPVPADHSLMKAWKTYQETDDFANTKKWAHHPEHVQGSLWACFLQGYMTATERAAALHESVNAASDIERQRQVPARWAR